MDHPVLKKPKLEEEESVDVNGSGRGRGGDRDGNNNNKEEEELDEQEEALVALIAHRANEVEHNKQRAAYYKSQVEVSERKLRESQSQLARLRSRRRSASSSSSSPSTTISNGYGNGNGVVEATTATNLGEDVPSSRPRTQPQSNNSRTQLVIPAVNPKTQQQQQGGLGRTVRATDAVFSKPSSATVSRPNSSSNTPPSIATEKTPKRERPSPVRSHENKQPKRRTFEQKEHQELITSIRSSIASPRLITFQSGIHISSQHKRKLRCLELSPVNDQIFVTSALDGLVNLWQVQGKGSGASLLSTTDCVSPKQRRWPEDIAWHPDGDSLFAVYSADGGDSQISILNLNRSGEKKVVFLQEKPHVKGIINSILFMPWAEACFATGGSDHAVMLWHEKDDSWKPKSLHREQHSSAVMGVAGLQQKKVILSVGADKRIVGFDLLSGRSEFKHQIESKCMSVLPNTSDFNLFMVQTGTPGKQLRLFDIRRRQTEIHAFGWKQESSESQSALINQAWSPDGLYLSSGSADPRIHIFDIRYNSSSPSQSVQAHQKRVFKAVWHQSLPLLTSISSDYNIGLHRIT